MPDFNNLDDVEKYLMDNVDMKKALKDIAYEIVEEIKEFIYREWYMARPESEYYDRTYAILSAFRVKLMRQSSKREIGVKIYIDDSVFQPEITDLGKWNVHASQIDESDVTADMPFFMDEGNNSPLYLYDGIHYMDELERLMVETDFPKQKLKTYLHGKGYVVDF